MMLARRSAVLWAVLVSAGSLAVPALVMAEGVAEKPLIRGEFDQSCANCHQVAFAPARALITVPRPTS